MQYVARMDGLLVNMFVVSLQIQSSDRKLTSDVDICIRWRRSKKKQIEKVEVAQNLKLRKRTLKKTNRWISPRLSARLIKNKLIINGYLSRCNVIHRWLSGRNFLKRGKRYLRYEDDILQVYTVGPFFMWSFFSSTCARIRGEIASWRREVEDNERERRGGLKDVTETKFRIIISFNLLRFIAIIYLCSSRRIHCEERIGTI